MIIDDFDPKVVEIFLRQIYNGAFRENCLDDREIVIPLLQIADRYNFTSLFDAIDSQLAQAYVPWNLCQAETLPETTESGPLCITDLFQNKSVAYF